MILAITAILAANISAKEAKAGKAQGKKEKKECKMTKEQRIECDIKMLSEELYLSEEQEAQFAVIYKQYMAEKAKLQEKFKTEFGKVLNERQVKRVLHFKGPKPPFQAFDQQGPRPAFDQQGPRPAFDQQGPRPACEKPCPHKEFKGDQPKGQLKADQPKD